MRFLLHAVLGVVTVVALGSCETMSEAECVVGDWQSRGIIDGAAGRSLTHLAEHSRACAKHGVMPDMQAYTVGRNQGLSSFCTVANGVRLGRDQNEYAGVCPANMESYFLPAYQAGRAVGRAERALRTAQNTVRGGDHRLEEIENKIAAKIDESRNAETPEQRDRAARRVGELRREYESTRQAVREAEQSINTLERAVSDAHEEFADYGPW